MSPESGSVTAYTETEEGATPPSHNGLALQIRQAGHQGGDVARPGHTAPHQTRTGVNSAPGDAICQLTSNLQLTASTQPRGLYLPRPAYPRFHIDRPSPALRNAY